MVWIYFFLSSFRAAERAEVCGADGYIKWFGYTLSCLVSEQLSELSCVEADGYIVHMGMLIDFDVYSSVHP